MESQSIIANESFRPTSIEELVDVPVSDKAIKLTAARIAYINYRALCRDFPALAHLDNVQIQTWFLDQFAYIAERQLKLSGIRNTLPSIDYSQTKTIYRPDGWNRAAIIYAKINDVHLELVDIKGIGIGSEKETIAQIDTFKELTQSGKNTSVLADKDHSDGLMSGGEAAAELTRQTAAQMLFELHNDQYGTTYQTVETYGIIDTGFDILRSNDKIPAALYVRQAHVGRNQGLIIPEGIYTDNRGLYQHTLTNTAVDFGAVSITDPVLAENFGPLEGSSIDPQAQKPWVWGYDVALAFRRGDHEAYFRHLNEMLEPLIRTKKWHAFESKKSSPQFNDAQRQGVEAVIKFLKHPQTSKTDALFADVGKLSNAAYPVFVVMDKESPPYSYLAKFLVNHLIDTYPELLLSGPPNIASLALEALNGKPLSGEIYQVIFSRVLDLMAGDSKDLREQGFKLVVEKFYKENQAISAEISVKNILMLSLLVDAAFPEASDRRFSHRGAKLARQILDNLTFEKPNIKMVSQDIVQKLKKNQAVQQASLAEMNLDEVLARTSTARRVLRFLYKRRLTCDSVLLGDSEIEAIIDSL